METANYSLKVTKSTVHVTADLQGLVGERAKRTRQHLLLASVKRDRAKL
jgi:hypothetical protein